MARNESGSTSRSSETALGDYQILSIGTIEPTLRPLLQPQANGQRGLGSQAILVCCDRPALFYLAGDRLDMQYLREDLVNQATMVQVRQFRAPEPDEMETDIGAGPEYVSMIAYENISGKIVVGAIEP